MSYKVGDKVRIIKENVFGEGVLGQEGIIIEIEDDCPFNLPIKIEVVEDYGVDIIYSNEESIEKLSPSKNASNKYEKAWEKRMDDLLNNRNGANVSQKNCNHEFIIVGTGLYGDYWNCKFCDIKKEDYKKDEEKDIPF